MHRERFDGSVRWLLVGVHIDRQDENSAVPLPQSTLKPPENLHVARVMQSDDLPKLPSQKHSKWATRSSMIAELQGFSEKRWSEFELVYKPLLLYWIRRKNVPPSAVDDILQEAWISIANCLAVSVDSLKPANFAMFG